MATAYVLIKTSPGYTRDVHYISYYFPEICESHPLVGEYDLIFKVKAGDYQKLGDIVENKIKKLPNIIYTETLPVTEI